MKQITISGCIKLTNEHSRLSFIVDFRSDDGRICRQTVEIASSKPYSFNMHPANVTIISGGCTLFSGFVDESTSIEDLIGDEL